jgi:2-phosphosulfolactate phosphatase
MQNRLAVHLLPILTSPYESVDATVVVIDVLRASTTICHALAAGAREIIPCLDVDEARKIAAKFAPDATVLGGERNGVRIEGFGLGNSPDEYRRDSVGGRTVVFTTTNGTRALAELQFARRVLIGSFVNFSALCAQLTSNQSIQVICAGTGGQITREDVLCAGAIADRLLASGAVGESGLNDQALVAAAAWRNDMYGRDVKDPGSIETLVRNLRNSRGGRNLIELGFDRDIESAAQIDHLRVVPELIVAELIVGNRRIVASFPLPQSPVPSP